MGKGTRLIFSLILVGLLLQFSVSLSSASSSTRATSVFGSLTNHGILHQDQSRTPSKVALEPTALAAAKTFNSLWAGYSQVEGSAHLYGGADGWIVPSGKCNSTSPSLQGTAMLAWFDGLAGQPYFGGVALVCQAGQKGAPSLYFYDSVGFYTGNLSVGDQVTSIVGDYDGTHAVIDIVDWTSKIYVEDVLTAGAGGFSHTDFDGVVDTFGGCQTATGLCPLVHFGKILDGTLYDNSGTVNCAVNPDKTTPPYPCVGYGATLGSGSTYFYPIGATVSGVKDYKDIMTCGDVSCAGTLVFVRTGGLEPDLASHTYKFLRA